jgi:hypothetical protein
MVINWRAMSEPTNEPTNEELKARIAELEKQTQRGRKMDFKIGEKGGVSVYGLGRFPVTLYYEQWLRLLDAERTKHCRRHRPSRPYIGITKNCQQVKSHYPGIGTNDPSEPFQH